MKRILVTGGCGFVGRRLVDALADRGDEVTVFDLTGEAWRDDIRLVRGDLTERQAITDACAGIDVVFHSASLVSTLCRPDPNLSPPSPEGGMMYPSVLPPTSSTTGALSHAVWRSTGGRR